MALVGQSRSGGIQLYDPALAMVGGLHSRSHRSLEALTASAGEVSA
jgi:hypothetical protein